MSLPAAIRWCLSAIGLAVLFGVETGTQLESITRPIPGRIFGAVLFFVEKRNDTNCFLAGCPARWKMPGNCRDHLRTVR